MALFSQRLTRSSLNEQPIIAIQRRPFEVLPFCASDDYDLDAHTFSAYGTSTDGILYLRRPKRLAVSRPKKPRKTAAVRKAWPDPRNAKEVASFDQKYLNSQHDAPLQSTHTFYTRLPQSVCCPSGGFTIKSNCLIASGRTIPTSTRISRRAMPPPPRFTRHANEV